MSKRIHDTKENDDESKSIHVFSLGTKEAVDAASIKGRVVKRRLNRRRQ